MLNKGKSTIGIYSVQDCAKKLFKFFNFNFETTYLFQTMIAK